MDKRTLLENTSEYNNIQAGVYSDGMPKWADRELETDYTDSMRKRQGFDKPFLVITLVILMIGIIMVLSASFARGYYTTGEPLRLFIRQFIFAVSGIALMLVTSRVSVKTMSRWSTHLLLISVVLLVLVLFIGIKVNGARRWIGIGGENSSLTFQPSEIAKLAVILAFAQMSCKFGLNRMRTFKFGVIPFVVITGVMIVLLRMEPHISAAIIITILAAIMMFAGGTRLRWFIYAGLAIVLAVGIIVFVQLSPKVPISEMRNIDMQTIRENLDFSGLGYEGRRINAWLDPDADPMGAGFQIRQSLNAVGSGGLLGQGIGQSRQKHMYLPEEHNDYIFAIVCEELGFIGALLILMLFALLIIRGYWLAIHAKDKFSALITIGITSLLAIQVFLNIAVVTNMLPATGISLPFFSYGGTALWIQLVQIGIILSVSREIPLHKPDEEEEEEWVLELDH